MLSPILAQNSVSPSRNNTAVTRWRNPFKPTKRQYVGSVCDLNARMAQMPTLFDEDQQLDDSELIESLANKEPRSNKDMLISQGFNPQTGDMETFVEHCE